MHFLATIYLGAILISTTSFPISHLFRAAKLQSPISSSGQHINPGWKTDTNVNNLQNSHRYVPTVTWLKMAATDMNWDPKSAPKLDFNEDYYSILEIDPEITSKDMKKAYYKIVFKYHPDNKEGQEQKELCNKQMMVINAAYKVLKDGDTRAIYDRKRKMGVYGEAAKAGKATGGSSNGKSQTQTQTQQSKRTTSSSSSYSSSSNPFDGYINKNRNDVYEATESLGDIFSDFWSEIQKGETKNLVVDLLDFLEDQVIYSH